jgi:hypothetical protein
MLSAIFSAQPSSSESEQGLAFFLITAVDEEFRAITGDRIRPSRTLGCTSAEDMSPAQFAGCN